MLFSIWIMIVDIIGQPPNPYDENGCCVSCVPTLKNV